MVETTNHVFRESQAAFNAKISYRWYLWLCTLGILAFVDVLRFRNHKLTVNKDSLTIEAGVITANSRNVPIKNIQSLDIHQSTVGKGMDYGDLVINTANIAAPIVFKSIEHPQQVRTLIEKLMSSK
jgi:membrane protein YdbS with pleckstrin-like domain